VANNCEHNDGGGLEKKEDNPTSDCKMAPEIEAEYETKMPEEDDFSATSASSLTVTSKPPKLVRRDTPIFTQPTEDPEQLIEDVQKESEKPKPPSPPENRQSEQRKSKRAQLEEILFKIE
jgi:hypothetical protein